MTLYKIVQLMDYAIKVSCVYLLPKSSEDLRPTLS
jgi:hypothetical protein